MDPLPPSPSLLHPGRLAQRVAALCPQYHQQQQQQQQAHAAGAAPPTPQHQTFGGGAGAGAGGEASPVGPPTAMSLDDSLITSPPQSAPAPAAPAVPRDPRQRPRGEQQQQEQQQAPVPPAPAAQQQRPQGPRVLRFMLPAEERYPHTTYFASHPYEMAEPAAGGGAMGGAALQALPCSHCKTRAWQMRCARCGRCQDCARLIFCKGAERRDNTEAATVHGHVELLAQRMDRAIWAAFRGGDDFLPIYALAAAGVSPNYKRTHKHETALMAAAYRADPGAVAELLRLGANPAMSTLDGMTALAFAERTRNQQCIDMLNEALHRQQQPAAVP